MILYLAKEGRSKAYDIHFPGFGMSYRLTRNAFKTMFLMSQF